jgi:glycosyltransferase involved in cell wall biosynthesis
VGKLVNQDPSLKQRIKLIIAGIPSPPQEQAYLDYLQGLISKLGLNDCVTVMTKFLSNDEISSLFNTADLMVAPYSVRVGPSGVLSFAMAYGIPAIVTFDERYFTRESKGPAFGADLSVAGIASAISKLMTDPAEYRKQIRLMEEYRRKNNNEKIAMQHVKLYKDLLNLRKKRRPF